MKQVVESYIFDPVERTVTLLGIPTIHLENILIITNVTDNIMIYNFTDPLLGASAVENNVITLQYNTSAMNATDRLQIFVDVVIDPADTFPTPVVPSLAGQQPIKQAFPVAIANEQILDLLSPMVSLLKPLAGTILVSQDCLQYRSVALQINASTGVTTGAITFEGSNGIDSSNNWSPISLLDSASPTTVGVTTFFLASGISRYFIGPIHFRYIRARVSSTVSGGTVSCLALYRMTPFSPSMNPGVNMAQLGGNTIVPGGAAGVIGVGVSYYGGNSVSIGGAPGVPAVGVSYYAGKPAVTGGLAGVPSVGGNVAPGLSPTTNPVTIGGVDSTNLIRRIITDLQGNQVVVGADPARATTTSPVLMRNADGSVGRQAPTELLELILLELKLQSYYLKELPLILSTPSGQFKEEISDFMNSTDKI